MTIWAKAKYTVTETEKGATLRIVVNDNCSSIKEFSVIAEGHKVGWWYRFKMAVKGLFRGKIKMKESNKFSIYILGCTMIGLCAGRFIDSKLESVIALLIINAVWWCLFFIRKEAKR